MKQITFSKTETDILEKVQKAATALDMEAYIIGGFVRDKILERPNKDIDIVCTGDSIELARFTAAQFKIAPNVHYFKNFGTAQIKMGSMEIEFVTARKESYRRDSRKPEVTPGTITDDQNRRDFTINALAIDVRSYGEAEVIDPFRGQEDLQQKLIRTPLDPHRTFDDDPLRMMRAVRFAAQLDFRLDESCIAAIRELRERIAIVSKERVADELHKIMLTPVPSKGLYLLDKCGLLELLLPQLCDLKGSQTFDNIGHKDNFIHSLQVLDNISGQTDQLWLRYAALFHDIGKARVKKFEEGTGWTFHGHEFVSGKLLPKIFAHLKFPTQDKLPYVRKIVELHHRPISLTKDDITDSAIRRLLFDAGDQLEDLMTLCEADITSKNEARKKRYLNNFRLVRQRLAEVEEKDKIRNWQPPVSGEVIMDTFGIAPGQLVGRIKDAIREAILEGEIGNNYEEAFAYMLEKGKELNLEPKD
ncbi:MAG: CCA tRNA nucleotidyltransferase [Taibaiella sp.]|nr:CCA tRNA nucleotidyltransferase [Taibaiella sp.]